MLSMHASPNPFSNASTARRAAARGAAPWQARQSLAHRTVLPEGTLDSLLKVAMTARDAELFKQVRPRSPPVAAGDPHPRAHNAWSCGDAYHSPTDPVRAKFWWSAAARFGDVCSSQEANLLLKCTADASQASVIRARAAMRLTVAQEAKNSMFSFAGGAVERLDIILQWELDYLPAHLLRGAQAFKLQDESRADVMLLRLWPSAAAAGLSPPLSQALLKN